VKLSDGAWSLLQGIIILAIVYMLVRPGSIASQAVTQVGTTLKDIVTAAVS
jgi:hypothetical protein